MALDAEEQTTGRVLCRSFFFLILLATKKRIDGRRCIAITILLTLQRRLIWLGAK